MYLYLLVLFLILPLSYYAYSYVTETRRRMKWKKQIDAWQPIACPHGKILVIVNPISGDGRSRTLYLEVVKPMLTKCGASFSTFIPSNTGHTREFIRDMDLNGYTTIMMLSGDGTIHETLNGLYAKSEDEKEFGKLLKKITFALVPSGTINGMATELGLSYDDPFNAVRTAIDQGEVRCVDLWKCTQPNSDRIYWDCTYLSWAVIGELDHWQERKLRNFGSLVRKILPPLIIITQAKKHGAILEFRPVAPEEKFSFSYSDPNILADSPVHPGMKRIESDFMLLLALNIGNAGPERTLSPNLRANEHALDILVASVSTRWDLFRVLFSLYQSLHLQNELVTLYKSDRIILTPLSPHGHMGLSGEAIFHGPVEIQVHPEIQVKFLYAMK